MRYFYPAIFQQDAENGTFTAVFPDLPGCRAEGKSMEETAVKAIIPGLPMHPTP